MVGMSIICAGYCFENFTMHSYATQLREKKCQQVKRLTLCVCVCVCVCGGSGGGLVAKLCLTLASPWTVAHQAPLSKGFPRQEYWNQLSFPISGDLPDPRIKPESPALQVDSLPVRACMLGCFNCVQAFVTLWTVA